MATVDAELERLVARALVQRRNGALSGWSLTDAGRAEHERSLAEELDVIDARSQVQQSYHGFRRLNGGVLEACSRWQVREVKGQVVLNDHVDATHDARVLADLDAALAEVRPVGEQLAATLERFGSYAPQLADALNRARAGEADYVTKPVIPSFHTVWFELHEDLLVTLGLDRASET